jgi:hypothetical protein
MTPEEFDALLVRLRQQEADSDAVLFKMPDVWVVANA